MVHCKSIPGIDTVHKDIDIVVIRENTEGEYSGLEHEGVPGEIETVIGEKPFSLLILPFVLCPRCGGVIKDYNERKVTENCQICF